jgi:hypothetical protein
MAAPLKKERENAIKQHQKLRGFQSILAATTFLTGGGVEMLTGSILIGVVAGVSVGVALIGAANLAGLYHRPC